MFHRGASPVWMVQPDRQHRRVEGCMMEIDALIERMESLLSPL